MTSRAGSQELLTGDGWRIRLTEEVGRGGEGSVYSIYGREDELAKVYHHLPDNAHQQKLRYMSSSANQSLLSYVAWPRQTIHSVKGGPIVGFTMSKISGRDPIHQTYSPAHRRQEKPGRKWDFLVTSARNTAAAFEAIHAQGHVVGDVNENGILIGDDALARLIDSDSFQIRTPAGIYRCKVGVPGYTPPELQGLPSFDGVDRNANHDNFGLAVLIFQLLLAGRHPFSGVPQSPNAGNQMSADIRAFRYSDATDGFARGLIPPPNAIRATVLPSTFGSMFFRAFTEVGVQQTRPTAGQWVRALDSLRTDVKHCARHSSHVYPRACPECPWCRLEVKGIVFFIDAQTSRIVAKPFNMDEVWRQISSVRAPVLISPPDPNQIPRTPVPRPPGVPTKATIFALFVVTVIAIVIGAVVLSPYWFAPVIGGVAALLVIFGFSSRMSTEREQRRNALRQADSVYADWVQRYQDVARKFNAELGNLGALRESLRRLASEQAREVNQLQSTQRSRMLTRHLQRCFIDRAQIAGIGPTLLANLVSFGVETAADVSSAAVSQVPGFGPARTQSVLAWRHTCESKFRFNAADPSTRVDELRIVSQYDQRRASLQARLSAGASALRAAADESQRLTGELLPELQTAAAAVAQARANLTVV